MKIDVKPFRKLVFSGVFAVLLPGLLLFSSSCEKDYFPQPPKPKIPVQTDMLEASYTNDAPLTINNKFWTQSDYTKISPVDLNKLNLYSDGLMNMTGTYYGKTQFNKGNNPDIIMKAAYDNQKVYILIEWNDSDLDASSASWLWNGPTDPLKNDPASGWTSQRNSDKVSLAFEINSASSSSGAFNNVGCMASCHNGEMKPQSGSVDIWKWDAALSDALGYSIDMLADATSGLVYDAGQSTFNRNNIGTTDRSGPEYEWDGTTQTITKPGSSSSTILDPAYYLINKTSFVGDVVAGDAHFANQCASCHGVNAEGGEGPALNKPAVNRRSRTNLDNFAGSTEHTGYTYYNSLTEAEQTDLVARIRAFAGVPGNYLTSPSGSSADIRAVSNVFVSNITNEQNHTRYKVLLIRNLITNNSDDVQFSQPEGKKYIFGVAFMDNDGKNHIGSSKQTIYFRNK